MSHSKAIHANSILRKMRLKKKLQPTFGSSHTMINNVDLRFGVRRNRGVGENRRQRSHWPCDCAAAALAPARSLGPTGPGRASLPGSARPGHLPANVRAGTAARLPARVPTLAAGLRRCGCRLPRPCGFKGGGGLGALSDDPVGQWVRKSR